MTSMLSDKLINHCPEFWLSPSISIRRCGVSIHLSVVEQHIQFENIQFEFDVARFWFEINKCIILYYQPRLVFLKTVQSTHKSP